MENELKLKHKISVITTFYNAEAFLLNAVNSVFAQKIPEFVEIEYVIVDDKSPDNSRKILENYIADHNKAGFVWKLIEPDKNLGCGGARKFGIENATGDYVAIMDADITGPSIPKAFGIEGQTYQNQKGILPRTSKTGIKICENVLRIRRIIYFR